MKKGQIRSPRHIKELVPDPENRRQHNPRNLGMVVDALHQVGAARSIVIDEDDVILAGNGVTEAAAQAGITKVKVVEVDGETLVAVRRRGLTAEQKRALAMYDNRAGELAEWNAEQLQLDAAAGLDLAPWFSPEELGRIVGQTPKTGRTDPDAVPQERATGIVRGDLFELGAHRLLCGDCTVQGDVARLLGDVEPFLMVTDPPYGVNYDPEWRDEVLADGATRRTDTVENDDRGDWSDAWQWFPGTVAYVWHDWLASDLSAASLRRHRLEIRTHIVWAKDRLVFSRGHYHGQHEVCWYAVRRGSSAQWSGDRSQSTLWSIPARDDDEGGTHSTAKPVECMRRPIQNHGTAEDHVYDPFVGSGTTIIACEQLGRRGFAIEIKPTYVQQAIDRWEAFTGQKAVKVGELVRT